MLDVTQVAPVPLAVLAALRSGTDAERKSLRGKLKKELGLSFADSVGLVERALKSDPPADWPASASALATLEPSLARQLRQEPDRYRAMRLARGRISGLGVLGARRLVDALRD